MSAQKSTKFDSLTKKQRLFIPVLLQSKSIVQACITGGIDRTLFYRWMQGQAFRAAVEAAQTEIVADAMHGLRLNLSRATETLTALLSSDDEAIQLRAANSMLEHHARLIESRELEIRLQAIEEKLAQAQQAGAGAPK